DFSVPIATGLALGTAARVGYFFNEWVGLYVEPRFSMVGQDVLFGYNLGASAVLQFSVLRALVLAVGPSVAAVGNSLSQHSAANVGAGATARVGADIFLKARPSDRGARAISLRLDAQPMYYTNGGLLTTIVASVGYELY